MADDITKDEESVEGEEETQDEESEETDEEQTSEEEKTEGDKKEEKGDQKPKTRRSEIAQKKHWRNKAKEANSKVTELETELETLRAGVKKPTDEKEQAAQEYIRGKAREVFKELQIEQEKAKAKELASFEEEVDSVLEDNPDVSEEELLDTIEELEVDPKTALRILKRDSSTKDKKTKPKMPKPKQGSSQVQGKKSDDSKKSIFEIAREETEKLKT